MFALSWIEEVKPSNVLIGSDSSGALISVKCMQSDKRQAIVFDITELIFRIKKD